MSDVFENVRIVDRPAAREIVGVSRRTWERMEARGETPPITKISPNRTGYRLIDLQKWLDSRRQDRGASAQN
jgi:predicted DNA-binding transcriptional regulator AlpA